MRRVAAWLAAGLLGAGLVLAGGFAFAGSGVETLQACYHNSTGALRVDVSGTGCRSHETMVVLGGNGLTTRVVTAGRTLPADGFGGVTAECGVGEVVLGGGMEVASINPDVAIVTNAPLIRPDLPQAWQLTVSAGGPVDITAFAVCAPGTAGSWTARIVDGDVASWRGRPPRYRSRRWDSSSQPSASRSMSCLALRWA